MPLLTGRYRITSVLGSGGMGIVYRAEDMLLRRAVALKILTGEEAPRDSSDRRWLREAQASAALNHPSVCMIYEAGEVLDDLIVAADGSSGGNGHPPLPPVGAPYLTMELIEGRTLSDRIRETGALPLEQAVAIAIQVAEGLAAAHARGIVHRDLKPGNVMLTQDGQAKILDFGLARQIDPDPLHPSHGSPLDSISHEIVHEGRVRGTLAYLSPERALGKRGESQSDIFSFGVLLYEMVSGVRPFQGDTTTALLAKILEAEPVPPVRLRPDLPDGLARIIARCIRKKPEERYNDTRDLVAALCEARDEAARDGTARDTPSHTEPTSWVPPPPPRLHPASAASLQGRMRRLGGVRARFIIIGSLVLLAAAALTARRIGSPAPEPQQVRTTRVTWSGDIRSPAISADGNFIAYVRTHPDKPDAIVVQDLRSSATIEIFRGGFIGRDLAFSPDGSEIAFTCFSRTGGDCRVYTLPFLGGTPKPIGAGALSPICWSPDGMRLAGWMGDDRILIFDKASGHRDTLRSPLGNQWLEGIAWAPRAPLLLLHTRERDARYRPRIIRIDDGRMVDFDLDSGSSATPVWRPDGRSIYMAQPTTGTLLRFPVNPETGMAAGRPVSLGYPVEAGRFGVSGDGRKLIFERSGAGRTVVRVDVVQDLRGRTNSRFTEIGSDARSIGHARISPSGDRIVAIAGYHATPGNSTGLVVGNLDGAVQQIILTTEQSMTHPIWSPDGTRIAYIVTKGSIRRVAVADPETGDIRVFEATQPNEIVEWASDEWIIYRRFDNTNYLLLDPRTEEERPLLRSEGLAVWQARPSLDGKWLAFARNVDGQSGMSVWIASLEAGLERPLYQGRAAPVGWSADGRQVFLVRENPEKAENGKRVNEIVAVPIAGGPIEQISEIPGGSVWSQVDVTPDARRIIYTRESMAGDAWIAEGFDPEVGR